MSSFLHGVEVLSVDSGPRPIRTVRSAVIGLVGTAPKGPVNTPVLVAGSRTEAVALFGTGVGTIPAALDAIFDQGGALVVVINVLDPATHKVAVVAADYVLGADDTLTLADAYNSALVVKDATDTTTYAVGVDYSIDTDTGVVTRIAAGAIAAGATLKINYDKPDVTAVLSADLVGGVDAGTGAYTGVHGLLASASVVHVTPKILCSPGYTGDRPGALANPVVAEMVGIADRLRAIIVTDAPNTTDADAIEYRGDWGSKRVYVIDPYYKVWDTVANAAVDQPPSARIAGVIAANDDRGNGGGGFWTSPSNRLVNGIVGTSRAVDFSFGDANCRANLLNEQEVATTIREEGYRLWGNRTCSSDPKWAFLAHVRLEDMILESLLRAHLWAVDRNITKTYADDVVEGVNAFLSGLVNVGAISGGTCWFDPELNTQVEMDAGRAFFNFDYGRYGVAERVTFKAAVNNDYTVDAVFG